ncbi:MAG: hypothetical protein AABX29_08865 [Nanoarchaeota archaeon]
MKTAYKKLGIDLTPPSLRECLDNFINSLDLFVEQPTFDNLDITSIMARSAYSALLCEYLVNHTRVKSEIEEYDKLLIQFRNKLTSIPRDQIEVDLERYDNDYVERVDFSLETKQDLVKAMKSRDYHDSSNQILDNAKQEYVKRFGKNQNN